jgi:hypothetical protein
MPEANKPPETSDHADGRDAYLVRLQETLCERGLQVSVSGCVLTATNPAVTGRLSPGLGQKVLLDDLNGDGLSWYWIWPALRPALPTVEEQKPDIELICGASKIDRAAHLIARVVRLRDEP